MGPRVRQARRRSQPRMTQSDLAARLQVRGVAVSAKMVAKIETGVREVTDYELVALAGVLGVSAAWLLGEAQ